MNTQVVYFSLTGQTRKFVQKLDGVDIIEINTINPYQVMDRPYILVVPTYETEVTEPVIEFIETGDNRQLCQGVFGGGNRNFAQLFCFTAKDIARDYQLPLLHLFEFQGSEFDVDRLKEELNRIETTSH